MELNLLVRKYPEEIDVSREKIPVFTRSRVPKFPQIPLEKLIENEFAIVNNISKINELSRVPSGFYNTAFDRDRMPFFYQLFHFHAGFLYC